MSFSFASCYTKNNRKEKIMGGSEMRKFEKDYIMLASEILQRGIEVENRTGVNTLKIPSYNFEINLSIAYLPKYSPYRCKSE